MATKRKPIAKVVPVVRPVSEIIITKKERVLIFDPADDYAHYKSLSKYFRKCLPATNYWAVINGIETIKVPESDKEYYKNFDSRCYEIRNDLVAKKEKLESFKKSE